MKRRLDLRIAESGLLPSREKARRAIMAGTVRVNGRRIDRPGTPVRESDVVELVERERFASRGGEKLEGALEHFRLDVAGFHAIDLGASTGGFTDCLLQRGAQRVLAVDVGRGQLAWKLRQDPRVIPMEKTNARHLDPEHLPGNFPPADLVTIDCSFISLSRLLPAARGLVRDRGSILALIKPQFEAGRREADRGRGVIRDPAIHRRVIDEIRSLATGELELDWLGHCVSSLAGPSGNREFFCHTRHHHGKH